MGVSAKYGFELYREIKEMRQKNDGGLIKYGFGQYKEVKEIWEKNHKVLTKYGFGQYKEIKGTEARKRWGLDKVWILYQ